MRHATAAAKVESITVNYPTVDSTLHLNCFAVSDLSQLTWAVRTYEVERKDKQPQPQEDRGKIKNIFWNLKRQYSSQCPGYGFIVDVNEKTIATPARWSLPSPVESGDYIVTFSKEIITDPFEMAHRPIISGIIREAVKGHFKNNTSLELGELWQDYDQFCQIPNENSGQAHLLLCRRFGVTAKVLRNNQWVLEFLITTAMLDGRTFADYYACGEVGRLADMIEAKRANRLTPKNRAVSVRVWWNSSTEHQLGISVLDLDDPGVVGGHANLSQQDQKSLAGGTIQCRPFNKAPVAVPLGEVRLVLDSQVAPEEHGETIIEPDERNVLLGQLRSFLDGIEVYGKPLHLAETPTDSTQFETLSILPPSIRMRNRDGGEVVIEAPKDFSNESLKSRARQRKDHIRRNGFLQQRPINPLLAWPKDVGISDKERAKRLRADLSHIWRRQGIEYEFEYFVYRDVEHLRQKIERDSHDLLFAVLPEGSRRPHQTDDTHEKIKRRIEVPSQCIQYDHTVPETWVNKPRQQFRENDPRLFRRIEQQYDLCLGNLLVKHNWVPFAPAEAFHYNVHVGLDVGGQHNNTAMACLGYGFQNPNEGLLFRPEQIPINVQRAEPIPTDDLYRGMLQLFEYVYAELSAAGAPVNFDRALFFRDGLLLGDGDEWNEKDALLQLYTDLRKRGWLTQDSVWTAIEILKSAEGWRLLRSHENVINPLVGQCLFPFEDESLGLVCTTGIPYLSQGTACPLRVNVVNLYGRADRTEAIRDLVWEADLCFTKVDMSLRLPWVLHVADTGALQRSRSYRISGITV